MVVVVLLVQPPNSSSAATFGAAANPPPAPGTMGWLAKEPPELPQPKSLAGAEIGFGSCGLCCLGGSGAEDHALLLPHTSAPERLFVPKEPSEPIWLDGAAAAVGLGWFAERLKTDEEVAAEVAAAVG